MAGQSGTSKQQAAEQRSEQDYDLLQGFDMDGGTARQVDSLADLGFTAYRSTVNFWQEFARVWFQWPQQFARAQRRRADQDEERSGRTRDR
jgi:hypothetical protein